MSQQSRCAICFLVSHLANCDVSGANHPPHSDEFGVPGQIRRDAEGVYSPDYWSSVCPDADSEDSVMGGVDGTDEQATPMRDREDDTFMSDSDDEAVSEEQAGIFYRFDVMEIDDGSWDVFCSACMALPDDSMLIDDGSDQLRKSELLRRFSVGMQSAVAI